MAANEFTTTTPAKWVLAGEHSVLRGVKAISVPLKDFSLKLSFLPTTSRTLLINANDPETIQKLITRFQQIAGVEDREEISGRLSLESDIPMGAGLGSSAALCVAVVRWLCDYYDLSSARQLDLAKELEDYFHGKSSGMDVATSFKNKPVVFSMKEGAQVLGMEAMPRFTFHDTDLRSSTKDNVESVQKLLKSKPALGRGADQAMAQATELARQGLVKFNQGEARQVGLDMIARAMVMSHECMEQWGLVPDSVRKQHRELLEQGASAVKLTGAGGGGFLVALWPDKRPVGNA